MSHLRDEKGIEVIEFMGIMGIIIIVAMIAWQFIIAAHVALITASAAEEGARAAAVRGNAYAAVARGIGGYQYVTTAGVCAGGGMPVAVTVRIRLPILEIPFVPIPPLWTNHTATARCEPVL